MDVVGERIRREGSLRFDDYLELALYEPGSGFFAVGGGAGRAGRDFITSPEVGPLFGAVLARWLDARWRDLGEPDPFVVVEAAAGRGALAIAVLAAAPACAAALRYVTVERSAVLRARQAEHLALADPATVFDAVPDPDDDPAAGTAAAAAAPGGAAPGGAAPGGGGPLVCALADLPRTPVVGAVVANELLDDLPFRLLQRHDGVWGELRVTEDPDRPGGLAELLVPADAAVAARVERWCPGAPDGARVPVQDAAADWLRRALAGLSAGSVLVVDYAEPTTSALAGRPWTEWLRTYADHRRGGHPLDRPGSQDVTVEVALDQLAAVRPPDDVADQATWLQRWGIDDLVADGRRRWSEQAAVGDLEALRARSRVVEAEALCDPDGLGAFTVAEWVVAP